MSSTGTSLRILVAIPGLPRPDNSAGDRRLCALLAILAKRHRVDVWVANRGGFSPEDATRYLSGLHGTGATILPAGWDGLSKALTFTRYHAGVFEFFHVGERYIPEFRRRQPRAVVLVDSVDVHFARETAGAAIGVVDPATAADTRRRELATYRQADGVIVVSREDAAILRNDGIDRLYTIPLIVSQRDRQRRPNRGELLFVGAFHHPPNADGLKWFMQDVWPSVRRQVPCVSLNVIGGNPPPDVLALGQEPGVTIHGFVADLGPFLDHATVSIAPLRYGGGMKGKVTEALAAGIPVVTTSSGIQGISAEVGVDLLVSDEPAGFAEAIVSLLKDSDRAGKMGAAGRRLATAYAPDRIEQDVNQMLQDAVPNPDRLLARVSWFGAATMQVLSNALRRLRAGRHSAL